MANSSQPSDEVLFERFRSNNDREALAVLFERCVPIVSGICAKMLANALAEEAAQETFLAIIRYAGSYHRDSAFRKWLLVVAVNSCRRVARRENQVMIREESLRATSPRNSGASPAEQAMRQEQLQDLQACLLELPPDQRSAIVLYHVGALTRAEVARSLSQPEGTVASWLNRGVDKLAAMMRSRGHVLDESALLSCLPVLSVPEFTPTVNSAAASLAAKAKMPLQLARLKYAAALIPLLLLAGMACLGLRQPGGDEQPVQEGPPPVVPGKPATNEKNDVLLVLGGGEASVQDVPLRCSADGLIRLLFDNSDNKVSLRDLLNPSHLLHLPDVSVADISLAADGKSFVLLGCGEQGSLERYEWPAGKRLQLIPLKAKIHKAARVFYASGERALVFDGKTLSSWDLSKGGVLYSVPLPLKLATADQQDESGAGQGHSTFSMLPGHSIGDEDSPAPAMTEQFEDKAGKVYSRTFYSVLHRKRAALEESASIVPVNAGAALAFVASGDDAPPRIVDIKTGKIAANCSRATSLPQSKLPACGQLFASPSGKWLVEARRLPGEDVRYCLTVFDPMDGKEVARREWRAGKNALQDIVGKPNLLLAFDNGEVLIAGDSSLVRWNFSQKTEPQCVELPERKARIFPATDQTVLLQCPGGGGLFNLKTGALTFAKGADQRVNLLAVSNDGRLLATSGRGQRVALWDLTQASCVGQSSVGRRLSNKPHAMGGRLVFSPDGKTLFAARGATRLRENANWNLPHLKVNVERMFERYSLLRGQVITETSWELERWDLEAGQRQELLAGQKLLAHDNHWWSFALNERFAALFSGREIRRFDLNENKELPKLPLGDLCQADLLNANGITFRTRLMLQPGRTEMFVNGRAVKFIDLLTGKVCDHLPKVIEEGVFSPDNNWLFAVDGKGVRAAILPGADAIGGWQPGFDVQFDPSGRRFGYIGKQSVVIAELPDMPISTGPQRTEQLKAQAAKVTAKAQLSQALVPPLPEVLDCRYSTQSKVGAWAHSEFRLLPGGKTVVFGGEQGACLFEVDAGQELARFHAFANGEWLITTPDGLFTGSQNCASQLRVYRRGEDITTPAMLESRRQPAEIARRLRKCLPSQTPSDWQPKVPPGTADDF